MNKTVIGTIIGFILGAAAGITGGYFYTKNKYLAKADAEIESVRKVYEKHFGKENASKDDLVEKKPENKMDIRTHSSIENNIQTEYKKYTKLYKNEPISTSKEKNSRDNFSIITPEEFRDSDYDTETLIWYADKILTDADNNIIHNINEVIGPEALNTFGRYLDDTVYVQDDNKQIVYEIIWDSRKFSSVNRLGDDPVLASDIDDEN